MYRRHVFLSLLLLLFLSANARLIPDQAKASNGYPVWNIYTGLRYASIQEAINANETLDGHFVVIDPYIFWEHIVVNKSVGLIGSVDLEVPDGLTTIDGGGTGTVVTVTADNVTIVDIRITHGVNGIILEEADNSVLQWLSICENAETGVYIHDSRNCTLRYSRSISNHDGVWLNNSNHNTICENKITSSNGSAVYLEYSSNNTILDNQMANNDDGIGFLYSSNNIISGNYVSNNTNGVHFSMSDYNTLSSNRISDNNQVGIRFDYSFNNTITGNGIANNNREISLNTYSKDNTFYHNDFVNNAEQVYVNESSVPPITNSWDDGFPSGGNYWSDYLNRYPNATEIDASGIGDIPYVIDANNTDRHPLMNQYISESFSFVLLLLFIVAAVLVTISYKRKHLR